MHTARKASHHITLTSRALALADKLLQQGDQVQKLFVISVVEPALDGDAVVNLRGRVWRAGIGSEVDHRNKRKARAYEKDVTIRYTITKKQPDKVIENGSGRDGIVDSTNQPTEPHMEPILIGVQD